MQGVPSMKTDSHTLGTDNAALPLKVYIEYRLSTLADIRIEDT